MQFIKMHGLGNDYVYVNGFSEPLPDHDDALADLARCVSDRHTGIGADGLILVLPPQAGPDAHEPAHVGMRMFNADGSEGEMCGNGIRCVCKLVHDHGILLAQAGQDQTPNPLNIETAAGILSLDYQTGDDGKVNRVTVDMGTPILTPKEIPIDEAELGPTAQPQTFMVPVTDRGQHEPSEFLTATFVSMGNPHAVIFVDDLDAIDFPRLGPLLERHAAFPQRMNVHFVQLHAAAGEARHPEGVPRARVVHWERGSGPTLACGTGACAVAVAAFLTQRLNPEGERRVITHLPGGDLDLTWRDDDHVLMTGPATEVFIGDYPA